MKKIQYILLLCMSCLMSTGCNFDNSLLNKSTGNNVIIQDINKVDLFEGYTLYEEDDKYNSVDSFVTPDGNYYYLYSLGIIDAVPIGLDNGDGIFYNGVDTQLSFTIKTGTESTIIRQAKNVVSNSIEISTSGSLGVEVPLTYAKVSAAIENGITESVSESFESSVTRVYKESNEFTKTVIFNFDNSNAETGYYCYTTLASIKMYVAVVYNPRTSAVEEKCTYSVIGKSMPGLIYSKTSFFSYNIPKIEFDISELDSFSTPQKIVNVTKNINFDSNGGACDIKSKECKLFEKFGSLPVPTRHGHTFDGWYQNGNKIDENSLVLSWNSVVANWIARTELTLTYNDYFQAQNSFGVLDEEKQTAKLTIKLSDYLDVRYLKDNGYYMNISMYYTVEFLTTAVGSLNYEISIRNGSTTIYKYDDSISSKTNRSLFSDYLDSSKYDGTMFVALYTKNIQGVRITNFKIVFEFFK